MCVFARPCKEGGEVVILSSRFRRLLFNGGGLTSVSVWPLPRFDDGQMGLFPAAKRVSIITKK